jgi:hypothetical protein
VVKENGGFIDRGGVPIKNTVRPPGVVRVANLGNDEQVGGCEEGEDGKMVQAIPDAVKASFSGNTSQVKSVHGNGSKGKVAASYKA